MRRQNKIWCGIIAGLFLTGAVFQIIDDVPKPGWARAWFCHASPWEGNGHGTGLVLSDPRRSWLRFVNSRGSAPSGADLFAGPIAHCDLERLTRVFNNIRDNETSQRQNALAEQEAYLRELTDRRLAAVRLDWEERYRNLAISLAKENDHILGEYAALVRSAYYAKVSSLEMLITMSENDTARQTPESELAVLRAEIGDKIAQKKDALDRQSILELTVLRTQADTALANIAETLRAEERKSLAVFNARQKDAFAAWLEEDAIYEASARRARGG